MGWSSLSPRLPRKFVGLRGHDRKLVLEAVVVLCAVRLGLAVLPFPLLRRSLRISTRLLRVRRPQAAPARIAWAVRLVATRLRKSGSCLPQALCGQWMLDRRGFSSQVGIGVARAGSGGMAAHAWLTSGGLILLGGPSSHVAGFNQIAVLEGITH